jgi:hypothetical protein
MKPVYARISLAGVTSFLLVAASLLGFSFVMPKAAVASFAVDNNTTTNEGSTPTANPTVDLENQPLQINPY